MRWWKVKISWYKFKNLLTPFDSVRYVKNLYTQLRILEQQEEKLKQKRHQLEANIDWNVNVRQN